MADSLFFREHSELCVPFYREYSKRCAELAELSNIPPLKKRLKALAQKYQEKAIELEHALIAKSPPLAPDHPGDDTRSQFYTRTQISISIPRAPSISGT
jgi:hypothetical protein